jgi:hypothetical protein
MNEGGREKKNKFRPTNRMPSNIFMVGEGESQRMKGRKFFMSHNVSNINFPRIPLEGSPNIVM